MGPSYNQYICSYFRTFPSRSAVIFNSNVTKPITIEKQGNSCYLFVNLRQRIAPPKHLSLLIQKEEEFADFWDSSNRDKILIFAHGANYLLAVHVRHQKLLIIHQQRDILLLHSKRHHASLPGIHPAAAFRKSSGFLAKLYIAKFPVD